jgi:hypothetical protein
MHWLPANVVFLQAICHLSAAFCGSCVAAARDAQDCSKTDTSADAVFRCVNAVRTNPQAFKSAYPCSTPWLSTISRSGRSPLNYNQKLTNSAQRQANDMARCVWLSVLVQLLLFAGLVQPCLCRA